MTYRKLLYKVKRFLRILARMEQDPTDPASCGALSSNYERYVHTLVKMDLCALEDIKWPMCGKGRSFAGKINFGCKKLCDFRYTHECESAKKSKKS